ncbi:ABC transporter permease [Gemmatimonas sp.]|uniref:ABC transporter permease n=1 Tax=Gemmatimonas sp. TaxID=1962908 RepID=UPI003F6F7563
MTRWQQVRRIARWEFNRFVKWRQQAYGVLIMVVVGTISGAVGKMANDAKGKQVQVAVIGREQLGFALPAVDGVRWDSTRFTTAADARRAITADSLGGALIVQGAGAAEIVLRKRAAWTSTVTATLTQARQAAAFTALPISDAQRAAMLSPFAVQVKTVTLKNGSSDVGSRLFTGAILMFGVLVLFNGFASLFAGITGEKQQRITEQIIAIVSPQTWMDGKIIGLVSAALVGTLLIGVPGLALFALLPTLLGNSAISLPAMPSDPWPLLLVLVVTVLGVIMWFSFMAAVAATIDDPNSSPRASMLLIPVLPMGLAFSLLSRPETWVAQALAIFPLTSMAVLPVRMLMTSVPWWEPVLAVLLLATASWTFRLAAGKIFALGILLHGKEPSWAEAWRWIRSSH